MKKILSLILVVLMAFSLASCSNPKFEHPISVSKLTDGESKFIMRDYENDLMLELLNKGKWVNDIPNCGYDYELEFGAHNILRYHSECGTFIDVENSRSLTIGEEYKNKINESIENSFIDGIDCFKRSYEPVTYHCDLSKFPLDKAYMGYGKVLEISSDKILVSPDSDEDKAEYGEVVWLICNQAFAYSEGQAITYTFYDVKAPDNDGEPLNIVAISVYME